MNKAIELKGIARSLTKIGVVDGQSEDMVNLRFKDGSWRVSTDGKYVYSMDKQYKDLYIHVNSTYRHVLGVDPDDNTLYWFANIADDGDTFESIERVAILSDVKGDVQIAQTGHVIVVKCDDKFLYAIFKDNPDTYKVIIMPTDSNSLTRELSPFGQVHLNFSTEKEVFTDENKDAGLFGSRLDDQLLVPQEDEGETYFAAKLWHASMLKVYKEAQDKNYFTRPFLAVIAVQLHDGSYLYASNPIYMHPREASSLKKAYVNDKNIQEEIINPNNVSFLLKGVAHDINPTEWQPRINYKKGTVLYTYTEGELTPYTSNSSPVFLNGALNFTYHVKQPTSGTFLEEDSEQTYLTSQVIGSKLLLTLGDISTLLENKDVFTGISIFITQEVDIYDMSAEGYKEGRWVKYNKDKYLAANENGDIESINIQTISWEPALREDKDIIYDLVNSPLYLLKTFKTEDLISKSNSTIEVDIYSDREEEKLLSNIVQQDRLSLLALDRNIIYGETIYNYNSRLHIANIKDKLFSGYPIDYFFLNNLMLTHKEPYEDDEGNIIRTYYRGVLPDVENTHSLEQFQHMRYEYCWEDGEGDGFIKDALAKGVNLASISVYIGEGDESIVVSKIIPYYGVLPENHEDGDLPYFVNDLSPLLSYPNAAATKMVIKIVTYDNLDDIVTVYFKEFKLKAHRYLNLAYYMNPDLKPIEIGKWDKEVQSFLSWLPSDNFKTVDEKNKAKLSANKMRVSATSNPFYFPYENTYQIGNTEIVGMMSNAVAVGTGQTGAAPLYIFCKDGIYALMVDDTGEMAYTNARIIARDVCNNGRSITPIDGGIVFTTDRGLMEIAGSEVAEIGQIAEGDVFDLVNRTYIDNSGIEREDKGKTLMFNAFKISRVGGLPESLIDNVDFLTYIKGSIINYNHNDRELMVSNPNPEYGYTYIMDRNGNWSRRDIIGTQYVNNYPTSYRVEYTAWYKVDSDGTPPWKPYSEHNSFYVLSQAIKLDSIGFKQISRVIVRGYFKVDPGDDKLLGLYVYGSYDGRRWGILGAQEKQGEFTDIGCNTARIDVKFIRFCIAGSLHYDSRIDFVEVAADGSVLNAKIR